MRRSDFNGGIAVYEANIAGTTSVRSRNCWVASFRDPRETHSLVQSSNTAICRVPYRSSNVTPLPARCSRPRRPTFARSTSSSPYVVALAMSMM